MEKGRRLEKIVAHLPRKAGRLARPFWATQEYRESKSGHLGTAIIHIFSNDGEIGRYERNYPSFGEATFEPFELAGRWYALYSKDYTATRLMSLPDCRDIGGEEPSSDGFCPVEFFVPRYRSLITKYKVDDRENESWYFESKAESLKDENTDTRDAKVGPWKSLRVGFIAGCVWGDDSSWKLEVIDLADAANGSFSRDAKFGHFEIAADLPLAAAVQLSRDLPYPLRARVLKGESRDVESGKRIDPYSDELVD